MHKSKNIAIPTSVSRVRVWYLDSLQKMHNFHCLRYFSMCRIVFQDDKLIINKNGHDARMPNIKIQWLDDLASDSGVGLKSLISHFSSFVFVFYFWIFLDIIVSDICLFIFEKSLYFRLFLDLHLISRNPHPIHPSHFKHHTHLTSIHL